MKKWYKAATFMLVLAFCWMPVQGQETEELFDLSLDQLLNLEITTASKFSQKINEAPSVISLVTREQIFDYGWESMNDILYRQPGFFPSQDYDRRTAGSRGLFEGWNNNHLLLLIDGIPFNDNLYGTAYTWEITPLFMVKSIEIIRGPGSALYGSNATNGVLSINTLSPFEAQQGEARFTLGNYGSWSSHVVGGISGELITTVMGFQVGGTDGNEYKDYDLSVYSGRVNDDGSMMKLSVPDTRHNAYAYAKFEGRKSLAGLSLQLHYQAWDFETGHGWLWEIPDFRESMAENRVIAALAYRPETEGNLSKEIVLRYQKHALDWNMRYSYNGSWEDWYPSGVWEYLNTDAEDIFLRAQLAAKLQKKMTLLGGFESTYFTYGGDDSHFSNTDLNNADDGWPPYANGEMKEMGPWFEWIVDKPVMNLAFYTQFASGELLGKKLEATLGLRYDRQNFSYTAIDEAGRPEESKTFDQVSPRLGLVFKLNEDVTLKALMGRAFRAPAPTEMFGANTWTLASNLHELKPEIVTTSEFACDWRLSKSLSWRTNFFYTKSENQIAYSLANNNLSTNIYTLTNAGLETEVLYGQGRWNGFFNFSYVQRLDEEILDDTISLSKEELTWAPPYTVNLGLRYSSKQLRGSLQLHYQGEVSRRATDRVDVQFMALRPEAVSGWVSVDLHIEKPVMSHGSLYLDVKNLLDSDNYLVKNFDFPFDYLMFGRQIRTGVKLII